MRDYWYILGLGLVCCMLDITLENWFPLGLYFGWIILLIILKRITIKMVVFTICFITFMMYYLPSPYPVNTIDILNEPKKVLHMEGTITSPLNETEKKVDFELKTDKGEHILVTYFKHEESNIRYETIQHGATCMLSGEKSIPNPATNPHQFDYQKYLWQKGITSQLTLTSMDDIMCHHPSRLSFIYSFRNQLKQVTEDTYTHDTVKWLHSLVLGDDSQLDADIIEVFRRWGLSHILAISGLHIGIVVTLIYFILIRLSITTKEKAKVFICVFLPIYALIAGGQPSVWRASIMVLIVILLSFFKRKWSYTDIISITFLLLIVLNKYIIFHIGFQLSFAVTFGIILSKRWLADSKTNIEKIFKISFVSQMMILPLQLHYFSLFEPLSIMLNIIIVPYFSLFVIPMMFIFLLIKVLPIPILQGVEFLFHLVNDVVISFIFWIDEHIHFPFIIGKLSLYFVIVYYVLFILFMVALEKKSEIKSIQFGIVLCFYITFLAIRPYLSPFGTVTILDIGQGDAIIIELPYRKGVYFMDIGATITFPNFTATDKEYKQIIRPYLYGQGISSIDAVFLSHEDLDHYGSLGFLLEEIPVGDIVISNYYELASETNQQWINAGSTIKRVQQKEIITHHNQVFHVLAPIIETDSPNENSLVIYTEIGGLGWLFTGDIGKETERNIVKHYPELTYDVLKVAHHGSNTSTDKSFIEKVNKVAIIPVGRKNTYGHPTKEVVETLENNQLEIYRTDTDGAIQYRFKDDSGYFKNFIKKRNKGIN